MDIAAVILAGGYGKRFWPFSRENLPKQCLPIASEKTMVEETIERLGPITDTFFLSTNEAIATSIRKLLPDINYVIEPMPKNTAAAIGLSALYADKQAPDSIVFVETTDHYYKDIAAYLEHVKEAARIADESEKIVLIGIKPTYPHPGLGYIKQGKKVTGNEIEAFEVDSFKEKPTLKKAEEYLRDGTYLWNSGMFVFKTSVMLDKIKKHMPALHEGLMKIRESDFDQQVIHEIFEGLGSISIDYGIMEKEKDLLVVGGNFHWDDIGDWKAMERIHPQDKDGNVIKANHKGKAKDCIIFSSTDRPIETENVEDLIIIDTEDCLLVCSFESAQDVKKLVEKLESQNSTAKYSKAIVTDPEPITVSIDSDKCKVKADCLVALLSVSGLSVERTKDMVRIKS